jgi:hypothetical protein
MCCWLLVCVVCICMHMSSEHCIVECVLTLRACVIYLCFILQVKDANCVARKLCVLFLPTTEFYVLQAFNNHDLQFYLRTSIYIIVTGGKCWKPKCKSCPNGMTEEEEIQLTVDLQAGMHHGEQVKFDEIADEAVGHLAGDLVFTVNQIPHPQFRREGDDLHIRMDISLENALLGFTRTFSHLDGHQVQVAKKDVTHCSEVFTIPNEGMPIKGQAKRGSLHITLEIQFPKDFSNAQKGHLKKAFGK